MNLFGKRPLALFCALFSAASVGGALLTAQNCHIHLSLALLSFMIAVLLLAVPLILRRYHPKLLTPVLAFVFVALALFQSWLCIDRKISEIAHYDEQSVDCSFEVLEKKYTANYLSIYRVKISHLNSEANVSLSFLAEWEAGDMVRGSFVLHAVDCDSLDTSYLLSDGIFLELSAEDESFEVYEHQNTDALTKGISGVRDLLAESLRKIVPKEEGNLVCSLLLNMRERLSSETVRNFRRTGTTHLLAISGMHLSVITLLAEMLLCFFKVGKKKRCVAVLLTVFGYLTLTGFALSACRAFLMCCFVYLAWLIRSDNDAVTSLFFALFFLLAISPASVYDIGLWMSVLAVLGILIAQIYIQMIRESLKRTSAKRKWIGYIMRAISAILVSLAAQIFVLLPMWLVFDELSLVALPCGLLLSPFVTLVLFLTPFALLLSWIPPVSLLIGKLLYLICRIALAIASYFSSLEGITVSFEHRFFSFFVPLSAFVIALLLVLKFKRKWQIPAAMGAIILSLAIFLCFLRLPPTDRIYIDILRHGESELLLFSADEQSAVCDMTNGSRAALDLIGDNMPHRCSTEISSYVLTHYHSSHTSGLSRLFSSMTVHSLCLPRPQTSEESSVFTVLLSLAEQHSIPVWVYDRGSPLDLGILSLNVSNATYLDRSVHPLFYVSAEVFDRNLLYISESAHEDSSLYREFCQDSINAEALIFGTHGTSAKQNILCPDGQDIFLTDESLLDHFVPPNTNTRIVCDCTKISFCWSKQP